MVRRDVLLFISSLFVFVAPAALARERSVLSVTWAPGPAQVAAWTSRAPDTAMPRVPEVSLKVALPSDAGQARLRVKSTVWLQIPSEIEAQPNGQPVALGARGVWHGISYQEILLRPMRPGGTGEVKILSSLEAEISIEGVAEPLAPPLPDGAALSFESRLFLNPSGALAFKRPGASAAPSVPNLNPALTEGPQALRIELSADGVYRMDYAYLVAHGFSPAGIAVERLHLICRGVDLPIWIEGPASGPLTTANAVVFYGQKLSIKNRPMWNGGDFSDTNVYWLYQGSDPGPRMAALPAAPTSGFPTVSSFPCPVHLEVNNYQDPVDHLRPNGDNWFWAPVLYAPSGGSTSRTYTLNTPHAAGVTLDATVALAGLLVGPHAATLTLNGVSPSAGPTPATWQDKTIATPSWAFSSGLLAGANGVALVLPGVSGQADAQFLDYFDFSYPRTLDADGGALLVSDANANATYTSAGYGAAPYILDVSAAEPSTGLKLPKMLTGAGFSSGTATFQMAADPLMASRSVCLSSAPLLPTGAAMVSHGAFAAEGSAPALLIITHPDFHPAGSDGVWQSYLARRRAAMSVQVMDIGTIYDLYSYGLLDPTALRRYLVAASAGWGGPPSAILLIGDASYDYKNYMGDPTNVSRVPTMMFEDPDDSTYMGRYPSDAWFADVNGDGYPDAPVGRIAVRSYDELAGVLSKMMAYEDQDGSGAWTRKGLFVADTWTQTWEQVFEQTNDRLQAAFMAAPWQSSRLYFHSAPYNGTDADAFAAAIRSAWPSAALVHYDGHSGITSMGNHYAFFTSYPSRNCGTGTCQSSDVDLLPSVTLTSPPSAPLPFVISSSCYNSAFDELNAQALMEALLARGDRGTIGSCGFSTIAYPDEEETFADAAFGLAFGATKTRSLGPLVDAGRFSLPSNDARSVMGNVLLGDPSLSLRLAAPAAPNQPWVDAYGTEAGLCWMPPTPAPASYNVYRSADHGVTWTRLNATPVYGTAFWDSGLNPGLDYAYYVASVDTAGFEGAPSALMSVAASGPSDGGSPVGPHGVYPHGGGPPGS